MRIKSIEVENFKSLVGFKLDLEKFTCLIGLNGSGKSTVLQFIDFLSQLVRGDMKGWLRERKWKPLDLKSKFSFRDYISFCVHFINDNGESAGTWRAIYNPRNYRCAGELIDLSNSSLEATSESVNIKDRSNSTKNYEIAFDYQGSILSTLKEELLPPSLLQCKKLLKEIKSLDLLDPEHLRKRTRESSGTIGLGGQNLAAFLHELNSQKKQELFSLLKQVYPQLKFLRAKSLPSGWKQIEIFETYTSAGSGLNPLVKTEARHINDGMLRLMAILAELMTENRFLLFDEIENGINPELVEFITDRLVNANQQVLVTTHSPLILNYLEDDIAKKGVIYLFRNSQGHTKSIPFFSIPSMAEKLKVMGPGEVYADTNLTELADEIVEVAGEGK